MESDSSARAADTLAELADDRARLAARAQIPGKFFLFFGTLAAAFVATAMLAFPAGNYDPPIWALVILISVIPALDVTARSKAGIKFSTLGTGGMIAWVGVLAVILLAYSASLGLMTLELYWVVPVVAGVTFGLVAGLSSMIYRSAQEHLRRV